MNLYAWAFPIFLVGATKPIFSSFSSAALVVLYERFVDSAKIVMVCSMFPTIRAWSRRRATGPPNMLANGPLVAYSSESLESLESSCIFIAFKFSTIIVMFQNKFLFVINQIKFTPICYKVYVGKIVV